MTLFEPLARGIAGLRRLSRVLGASAVCMRTRKAWHGWLPIGLIVLVGAAQAHKASDAYLQIESTPTGLSARWDIALRDLDAAVTIDADDDGRLTWGEVRAAWPQIEAYALPRLRIAGCPLHVAGSALERRNDGAYAVLRLESACGQASASERASMSASTSAPTPSLSTAPAITYTLFREIDPTHRGIAKVQFPGRAAQLFSLDPGASPPSAVDAPAGQTRSDESARAGTQPHAGASTGGPTGGFLADGIHHILSGYDHVLFLVCLLLPAVTRRAPQGGWQPVERLSQAVLPVAGVVTAFTLAHSITLGLAASGVVALPASIIEPAIAVTIVLAALDNLWRLFPWPRVAVTFVFGLVHGFGFANVLAELKLPAAQFAWALLQFNVGLELGQLAIVGVLTTLLFVLRKAPGYRTWVVGGGSCAAALVGALWLIERTANVALLPI